MIKERIQSEQVLQRWLERAREEGIPDAYLGRRKSLRFACIVRVEIEIGTSGGPKRIYSSIRDISEEGLGIHCREPIGLGMSVRVYVEDPSGQTHYLDGIVDHCTDTAWGFKVGIRAI